jgi:hypothetical protein
MISSPKAGADMNRKRGQGQGGKRRLFGAAFANGVDLRGEARKEKTLVKTFLGAILAASLAWPVGAAEQGWPRVVKDASGRWRHVVQNANDCAPWLAEPVWGPGPPTAKPLGYRCYYNRRGGGDLN